MDNHFLKNEEKGYQLTYPTQVESSTQTKYLNSFSNQLKPLKLKIILPFPILTRNMHLLHLKYLTYCEHEVDDSTEI